MRLIVQPDEERAADSSHPERQEKRRRGHFSLRFGAGRESALQSGGGAWRRGAGFIAHTNRGGEKELRKLERRLLKAGVTVARTDDDLIRYHGKLLVIDGRRLFVMGFNYTELDLQKSRSFGVVTRSRKLIADAGRLIEADSNRQNFGPSPRGLVVSPENAQRCRALSGRRGANCSSTTPMWRTTTSCSC